VLQICWEFAMRRALSVLAVAGILGLAACSDTAETTGPGIDEGRGRYHPPTDPTTTCTPSALRSSAGAVFGNGSDEYDLARLITTSNAGSAFATNTGFKIISAVAALRGGSDWNPALAGPGATLTAQLFPCMNVQKTQPTTVASITEALGAEGSYQVRGGPDDPTGDVLAWDGKSGIKAPAPWATWLGARALFLGNSIATFATEISGGSAYDWSMVHTGVDELVPAATVALCADEAPDNVSGAQLRLQHLPKAVGGNILPTAAGNFLPGCTPGGVSSSTFGARLIHALARLVQPAPLHASAAFAGGIGGLKGSFSPFEIVYGAQIQIGFVTQPANGTSNSPIKGAGNTEIQVRVGAAQGTPWEGVLVHINVSLNNGSWVAACGNVAETDAAGIAHFPNLTVNKAGGYILVASTVEPSTDPDVTAYSAASVRSNGFNMKNSRKSAPC
jgi:hypothetical protein